MVPPNVLLLDADGVVQLPAATWRHGWEALCADPERCDEFLADIFSAERLCLTGSADFQSSLETILAKWDSTVAVTDALRIWDRIEPDQHMLEVVASLRSAGVVVALATNQQSYRAAYMADELGYCSLFDHLLFSCELGHAKPSTGYFSAALAWVDLQADEALFIDDHESNVLAARSCGLKAEIFHLSEGIERMRELLSRHGFTEI